MDPLDLALLAYVSCLGALSVSGLQRLVLLRGYLGRPGVEAPPALDELPHVTVQLPIFEEVAVVDRLLDAVGRLDWPKQRATIQVLDDSRDATTERAAAGVARLVAAGWNAQLLHRSDRAGFKAGALAAGLARADGDVVAIFDADFVPPADFLRRTVPHLRPGVACVQASWGHLSHATALTRAQALLLDGHFRLEQPARQAMGLWFNFNGTAGIWRRQAIESSGGWQAGTLVEDMDLSYRAWLGGWRFVYLEDVIVPAELPADMASFAQQQRRWAQGTLQVARSLLPRLLRAPVPLAVKAEAAHHLLAPLSWPLMVALTALLPWAVRARLDDPSGVLAMLDFVLFGATLAPFALWYTFASRGSRSARMSDIPLAFALGIGIAASQSVAVWAAFRRWPTPFARTPKRGDGPAAYRATAGRGLVEGLLAAGAATAIPAVVAAGDWLTLPFIGLFVAGPAWVAIGLRRSG